LGLKKKPAARMLARPNAQCPRERREPLPLRAKDGEQEAGSVQGRMEPEQI